VQKAEGCPVAGNFIAIIVVVQSIVKYNEIQRQQGSRCVRIFTQYKDIFIVAFIVAFFGIFLNV
jgi:hypothetical protein